MATTHIHRKLKFQIPSDALRSSLRELLEAEDPRVKAIL
jgi:hypothetical protein